MPAVIRVVAFASSVCTYSPVHGHPTHHDTPNTEFFFTFDPIQNDAALLHPTQLRQVLHLHVLRTSEQSVMPLKTLVAAAAFVATVGSSGASGINRIGAGSPRSRPCAGFVWVTRDTSECTKRVRIMSTHPLSRLHDNLKENTKFSLALKLVVGPALELDAFTEWKKHGLPALVWQTFVRCQPVSRLLGDTSSGASPRVR